MPEFVDDQSVKHQELPLLSKLPFFPLNSGMLSCGLCCLGLWAGQATCENLVVEKLNGSGTRSTRLTRSMRG